VCDLDANQLTAGHRVFWGCLAEYADDHHVTDDQCPVGYHTNEPFNQCVKFAPSVVGEDHDHGSGEDHEHGSGEDHEHGSGEDEDHDDHGDHDHGGDHDDRYAGAEYRSSDCSGTPVRTWNLPSFPFDEASAEGTCFTPDGYWSVGDEWCDDSGAQMRVKSVFFPGVGDCTGAERYDNNYAADGSCVDVGDGTSYRFYCGGYADLFLRGVQRPWLDLYNDFPDLYNDLESGCPQCDDIDLCDLTRYSFEGGAELACAEWLGAGYSCESTWPEVCGGKHELGDLYNLFPLGWNNCPQCSDYCPITRERCEILADLGADVPDNCNCGDCGFPACGDCNCDHYGEHCCTGNDH
jgi:hypothetical protein